MLAGSPSRPTVARASAGDRLSLARNVSKESTSVGFEPSAHLEFEFVLVLGFELKNIMAMSFGEASTGRREALLVLTRLGDERSW